MLIFSGRFAAAPSLPTAPDWRGAHVWQTRDLKKGGGGDLDETMRHSHSHVPVEV